MLVLLLLLVSPGFSARLGMPLFVFNEIRTLDDQIEDVMDEIDTISEQMRTEKALPEVPNPVGESYLSLLWDPTQPLDSTPVMRLGPGTKPFQGTNLNTLNQDLASTSPNLAGVQPPQRSVRTKEGNTERSKNVLPDISGVKVGVRDEKDQFNSPETKQQIDVRRAKEVFDSPKTKAEFDVPNSKERSNFPETREPYHVPETKEQSRVTNAKEDFDVSWRKERFDAPATMELLEVLRTELETARCVSHCSQILDLRLPGFQTCNKTCRLLSNPSSWSGICTDPSCSEGCTTACETVRSPSSSLETVELDPTLETVELDPSLDHCSLYWTARSRDGWEQDGLQFLVAAMDRNGMFYHVGTTGNHSLSVPEYILNKASALFLVSVAPTGVTGVQAVQVEEKDAQCARMRTRTLSPINRTDLIMSRTDETGVAAPVVLVAILSTLLLLFVLLLVFFSVLYRNKVVKDKALENLEPEKPSTPNPNTAYSDSYKVYSDLYPSYSAPYPSFYPSYDAYISSSITL